MNILKRVALVAAILLAIVYGAAAIALYTMQREFVFPGQHTKLTDSPISSVPDASAYRVTTSSGASDAWFLPPLAPAGDRAPVLIFGHGNGEVIDQWLDGLDEFRRWGLGVFLVEYPGYGRSDGGPSELGIREAFVGAYDLLISRRDVDPERIVGYGQSLGGGAICALADKRPMNAMILQSTFTSLRGFAGRYFMPEFLIRDPFDNANVLRTFRGPVLVLHGRNDGLIPFAQGEELARIAAKGTFRLYECGHWCWLPDEVPLLADIHMFLRANGVLPALEGPTSSRLGAAKRRPAQPTLEGREVDSVSAEEIGAAEFQFAAGPGSAVH